jgi:hypothetical protein
MIDRTSVIAAALGLTLSAGPALAGAASTPTNYQPDPALQRASRIELEARIRKACTVTQARTQNVSEGSLSGPCGCYANRTLASLDASELQAYRNTGVFNDGARAKALAAIDACRLQRPV